MRDVCGAVTKGNPENINLNLKVYHVNLNEKDILDYKNDGKQSSRYFVKIKYSEKTRVQIRELLVHIHEVRVQIHELGDKKHELGD